MAQTTVMRVKVVELSKYGFKTPAGTYMGLSKQFKDQAKLVPGAEFEAEVYIADSGKEYLNKIISATNNAAPTQAVAPSSVPVTSTAKADTDRTKRFTPKFQKKDDAMSREDWDRKDQRISRQGVIQAAVIALAPTMATEGLFKAAEELATKMLGFVNPK